MKKDAFLITLFTLLFLFSSNSSSAQKYRGDFETSFGFSTSHLFPKADNLLQNSALDFTTSHGVQLNKIFIGAGGGVMLLNFGEYPSDIKNITSDYPPRIGVSLPFYIKGRYDFWNTKGFNPYISIKVGYIFNLSYNGFGFFWKSEQMDYQENGIMYQDNYSEKNYYKAKGLYLQPQIGMRLRTSKNIGINIGLSYNLINIKDKKECHTYIYKIDYSTQPHYEIIDNQKFYKIENKIKGILSLTVGFDF